MKVIDMYRLKMLPLTLTLAGLGAVLVALPAAAQDFKSFQSPSGNIGCFIMDDQPTYARCDIRDYTPTVVNDQGLCELEYGDSYAISGGASRGEVVCHGDTAFDSNARVLKYGQEITMGDITCWSEKTGMTCANNNGAGFTVAKARQETF